VVAPSIARLVDVGRHQPIQTLLGSLLLLLTQW
jgi:hypothetical protein